MSSSAEDRAMAFLAELEEQNRFRNGVAVGKVSVDSGCVEFSFDGRLARSRMTELHERVSEMTLGSAKAGFDGWRGFVSVENDGEVEIIECHGRPPAGRKTHFIGQAAVPRGATAIGLGDCGKVCVRLKIRSVLVAFFREEGRKNGKLWVCL